MSTMLVDGRGLLTAETVDAVYTHRALYAQTTDSRRRLRGQVLLTADDDRHLLITASSFVQSTMGVTASRGPWASADTCFESTSTKVEVVKKECLKIATKSLYEMAPIPAGHRFKKIKQQKQLWVAARQRKFSETG